jgi:hypothetical protein
MKNPKKKDHLKPIRFYPHRPEDIIRAFLRVDPDKIREKGRNKTKDNKA